MMRTTPLRRITLQFLHILLTEALTFITYLQKITLFYAESLN